MGLVNPQPTVFHIFQVRSPPAALAWVQCFPCSQNGWYDQWSQAIPALSDLKICFALALHELGMPAYPCLISLHVSR